jgi:hypothetical protein
MANSRMQSKAIERPPARAAARTLKDRERWTHEAAELRLLPGPLEDIGAEGGRRLGDLLEEHAVHVNAAQLGVVLRQLRVSVTLERLECLRLLGQRRCCVAEHRDTLRKIVCVEHIAVVGLDLLEIVGLDADARACRQNLDRIAALLHLAEHFSLLTVELGLLRETRELAASALGKCSRRTRLDQLRARADHRLEALEHLVGRHIYYLSRSAGKLRNGSSDHQEHGPCNGRWFSSCKLS